ncbi:LamG domain-containing protein [Shewanella sp. 10N.286.52.B9]|uniref:LamG domain-containing protein n=1 Tax=Shewanella sp. 10N.286.52.B9 TaxID=1880837 RepID=UPI000C834F41|nr:LamG domain-containing protein [Shewanella sp. 10N.286.52.B9]
MKLSQKTLSSLSVLSLCLTLTACGGGDVESNPPQQQEPDSGVYTGPAPATEDIQKYKVSLWDNISTQNRCGACHTEGNQAPYFASREDVNDAYAATNPLVDLTDPASSRLVEKVAGGHNCWLDSDSACGETMTSWIKLWSDERVSSANTIELTAPVIREPGASKSFPDDSALFSQHVYPIVSQYCVDCHNEGATFAQSPFFASNDIAQAYESAKNVINIDEPSQSRLVVRLGSEFHNCWTNCQENSNEMLAAVTAMSDAIAVDEISPEMVVSKSLRLTDGITASSGGRFETDVIALYQFKTGEGSTAYDTSGIAPEANLSLTGDVEWLGSWGLSFTNGKAQASTANSKKLHDLITSTGEFSVEAWVTPNNVTQEGPARIVTYSAGDDARNFTLGQSQYNYDFMLRTEASSTNGEPALSTPDADEVLQATLQHVVLTYNATEGRKIYVNGNLIEVADEDIAPLASWDDSFALILGREASNQHVWQGDIRLLAIYNRVLEQEQISQNYDVGVGEKFFLLFSVSHLIDLPNTYVMFEVSQFDNYSYLFTGASLVNIDGTPVAEAFDMRSVRIGINGKESAQGQAYSNVDLAIESGQALAEPMSLSALGTIIGLEKGASQDEFFLTFEQIGEHENVVVPGVIITPDELPASTETAQIGLRNFAEINHSMSELTGVPQQTTKVFDTYALVKSQLPSVENIDTFISAQQMGVTQLAIAYCDVAIDDDSLRSAWFPDIDFMQEPNVALSSAERPNLLTPLIGQLMPLNLSSQPDANLVYNELDSLVSNLSVCGTNCNAERTQTIAKASCAAVLASAVMLIQ